MGGNAVEKAVSGVSWVGKSTPTLRSKRIIKVEI